MKRHAFLPVLVTSLSAFCGSVALHAQQPITSAVHFLPARHDLPALASIVMDTLCFTADHRVPWRISITAHTDADGTFEYNNSLSQRRANTVKESLEACGLTIQGMTVECYGESRPVADNKSTVGKARNRRVEITLTPMATLPVAEKDLAPFTGTTSANQDASADPMGGCLPSPPSVYSLLDKPEYFETEIDPSKDQWVRDGSGIEVFIPAGTYPQGYLLKVRMRTATSLSEVMRMKYTTVTGGKPLESAGMFNMEVTRNGNPVQPITGKKFVATFPSPDDITGFSSWTGRPDQNGFTTWNNGLEKGFNPYDSWKINKRSGDQSRRARWSLIQALKRMFSVRIRFPKMSRGEKWSRKAIMRDLGKTKSDARRLGIAFGFSSVGLNCDRVISTPCANQQVALRSDSAQVVMLHIPQTFSTFYAQSIDPKKNESQVYNIPVGQPAWIVVLRSTKGYLEFASLPVTTCQRREKDFDFHAVTADEAYDLMDRLGNPVTPTNASMGGN